MSALPPIADIRQRIEHVCFVPKADINAPIGMHGVSLPITGPPLTSPSGLSQDVRYRSLADIGERIRDVRFTLNSSIGVDVCEVPLADSRGSDEGEQIPPNRQR
jgi:hypothetical protein